MKLNRFHLCQILMSGLALASVPAHAVAPAQGQYVLNSGVTGKFKYTPLRAIIQYGSEGRFTVGSKVFPGSMYGIKSASSPGSVGMVWYFGSTGRMAGSAVVQKNPDLSACLTLNLPLVPSSCYTGTMTTTDPRGNVTGTGILTVGF